MGVIIKMNNTLIMFTLIIFLGILCFTLGYIVTNHNTPLSRMETGMDYTDNTNCSNTNDLLLDSQCLRHMFDSFFKYNISNVNYMLNLSSLKSEGGVCWHSSLWYNDNLEKLGYKSKEVIIEGNNLSHQFTIGYTENITQICIFDQGVVKCW